MPDPVPPIVAAGLRKADLGTGIVLAIFGMVTLVAALNFRWDLPSIRQDGWFTAPGVVPAGVAVILIVQGVYLAIQALRLGGRWRRSDLGRIGTALRSRPVRVAAMVALLLCVYIFGLVGRMHFTLASFLFLVGFMFLFRAGIWWKLLLISAIAAGAISFVFAGLVRVPLP